MRWIVTDLTEYWLKKQEIWGCVNRQNDNKLEAVAFWEPPENDESSLRWLLMKDSAKGYFKFGMKSYGILVDKFKASKDIISKEIPNRKAASVIHYFAVDQNLSDQNIERASADLLYAICEFVSVPTVAILYKDYDLMQHAYLKKYFEKAGFHESNFKLKEKQNENIAVMVHEQPGRYSSMRPGEAKQDEKMDKEIKNAKEEKKEEEKKEEKISYTSFDELKPASLTETQSQSQSHSQNVPAQPSQPSQPGVEQPDKHEEKIERISEEKMATIHV